MFLMLKNAILPPTASEASYLIGEMLLEVLNEYTFALLFVSHFDSLLEELIRKYDKGSLGSLEVTFLECIL